MGGVQVDPNSVRREHLISFTYSLFLLLKP
jgi:hypothetical protein